VGFEAIDRILASSRGRWTRATSDSVVAEATVDGHPITLMKPLTYMNLSGRPVSRWVTEMRARPSEVMVYFDDAALPLGVVRVRKKGSAGGHRGLASIIDALGTEAVPRCRIGIGTPGPSRDLVEFVLSPFGDSERPIVDRMLGRVVEATAVILSRGIETAMSQYNSTANGFSLLEPSGAR
jgi:PTH1 family peptidyl-tRNA hydrolase